jgi:penicillin-binding protein 1C
MWFAQVIKFIDKYIPIRVIIISLFATYVCLTLLDLLFPLPGFKLDKDYSTVYIDRNGSILRIDLSPSQKYRIKMPLKEMSPYIVNGIIQYEDKWFYYHNGINPFSLGRAFFLNLRYGRIVSGASTISMQIARMIERRPRNISAKIAEAFRALQLEREYSKEELLEIYLNTIPMGGNVEGVGAGAYWHFGKSARDLSSLESAMLIGLPNSPNRNRPDRYLNNANIQMQKVLSRIGERLVPDAAALEDAKNKYLSIKRNIFPFRSPHLIETHRKDINSFYKQFSIDLAIQTFCENTVKNYNENNKDEGIYNGAVIVVNNKTHEVVAYVGSPDYFDNNHCGQINGAAIARSPGSALKPFLYARGVEAGIITPAKIVYDIPLRDLDYSPANFENSSAGPVRAKDALTSSLNLPAVRLERELGDRGLKGFLMERFPARHSFLVEKSGLSIVLGAFPLTLEQMTELYMMLANGGMYYPLKFFLNENISHRASRQVLDPRACYIISEMLSESRRPDLPFNWEFTKDRAKVAIKTGTSFGFCDAWCFGYNPDYTIGVWQGNATNRGSSYLIGVRKAGPLMIQIFNHLTRRSDSWFTKPAGVAERIVCSKSGERPNDFCKEPLSKDLYIPGVSSEKICSVHKKIFIRKKDGKEVCTYCMNGNLNLYEEKIVEYWTPEAASFFRKNDLHFTLMPEHNPECIHYYSKDKPQIVSPVSHAEYEINDYMPIGSQKIPLKAIVAQDADKIYWFLGSELISDGLPDETFFLTPERGQWTISAVDSKGRSSSIKIKIY